MAVVCWLLSFLDFRALTEAEPPRFPARHYFRDTVPAHGFAALLEYQLCGNSSATFARHIVRCHFDSKSLAIAETGEAVNFSDYGVSFLLILSLIGIWLLQSRINRLYARRHGGELLMDPPKLIRCS